MSVFKHRLSNAVIQYFTDAKGAQESNVENNRFYRNEDDHLVYAKKIISMESLPYIDPAQSQQKHKTQYDYLVRLAPDLKRVFDPRVKYSIPEDRPDFVTRVCKDGEKPLFAKVNQLVFEKYLNFLLTYSDSLYKECNRLTFNL